MAIETMFSSQLKQLANLPQRAVYTQVQAINSGITRAVTKPGKPGQFTKRKFAKEILWFFGAVVVALLTGLLIFYLIGFYIPNTFIGFVSSFGTLEKFYFIISLICLVCIYLARIIAWAIKTVSLDD